MATEPIPQVIPPADKQAQAEPGVGPVPTPDPTIRRMPAKAPFRTPVFPRVQSERGMNYGMTFKGEDNLAPTIPLPVRSSLAQQKATWRVQLSHYIYLFARATRFPGMPGTSYSTATLSMDGYPTAKVSTLLNTSPRNMRRVPRPASRVSVSPNVPGMRRAGAGYPTRSGYMAAPRRFSKALPIKMETYTPPTY